MARKKTHTKSYMGDINILFLAALAALIVGGFGIYMYRARLTQLSQSKQITVDLKAENNSGESGKATLTEVDGKTVVSLNLTGAPKGITQPAHIHAGECPGVGAVKYPLSFPVDGKSETTLNVTLAQLQAMGKLALNVHKSTTQGTIYVSCGVLTF